MERKGEVLQKSRGRGRTAQGENVWTSRQRVMGVTECDSSWPV